MRNVPAGTLLLIGNYNNHLEMEKCSCRNIVENFSETVVFRNTMRSITTFHRILGVFGENGLAI